MRSFRLIKWFGAIAVLGILAIQGVPVDRGNPPVTGDLGAPPAADAILRRACYDCHSNEVRWPWYAYVAPASWLVARDVADGRRELNFSEWNRYTEKRKARFLEEIVDQMEIGEMPPQIYLPMHPEARISAADLETIREWIGEEE